MGFLLLAILRRMVRSTTEWMLEFRMKSAMRFVFCHQSTVVWPNGTARLRTACKRRTSPQYCPSPLPTVLGWNRFRSSISAQKLMPSTPIRCMKPSQLWIHRLRCPWPIPDQALRMLESRSEYFQSFWFDNLWPNPYNVKTASPKRLQSIRLALVRSNNGSASV